MISKTRGKSFFYILLSAMTLLCLVIFWPFLPIILIGAALAVVLHPIYTWIHGRLFRGHASWLSALITITIFIIIIAAPIAFLGTEVVVQSRSLYVSLTNGGSASEYISQITSSINNYIPETKAFDLSSLFHSGLSFLTSNLGNIFSATLNTGLSIFFIVLSLFYFLKDGDRWKVYLVAVSPLPDEHDERILKMLGRTVNGVMRGNLLMALVQGLLLGAGLHIFGVPNAALWGVLAGIASFVPTVGTALVSIPAILYLLVVGEMLPAVGLAVWAATAVGLIDNFLSPVIVGKNIELPPLIILFAVLGGITLFGAAGIFIGPLAVSLFYTLIRIYHENFQAK